MYDPDTNLWTTLPNFTIPRLLVRQRCRIQCIALKYVIIARVDYFLTVLEGKLTAVDIYSFEVLEGDDIWTKHKYSGAKRPYFNFVSYALLPTSM